MGQCEMQLNKKVGKIEYNKLLVVELKQQLFQRQLKDVLIPHLRDEEGESLQSGRVWYFDYYILLSPTIYD